VTSVYSATEDGFRVYVNDPSGITTQYARDQHWHLNWKAVPQDRQDMGSCAGISNENWKNYGDNGIYIDVDTSKCAGLATRGRTPSIFTSVVGAGSQWLVAGTTSIYDADFDGFRVFLYRKGTTPDFAKERDWRIQWVMQP
jgi:hypothetical protein